MAVVVAVASEAVMAGVAGGVAWPVASPVLPTGAFPSVGVGVVATGMTGVAGAAEGTSLLGGDLVHV